MAWIVACHTTQARSSAQSMDGATRAAHDDGLQLVAAPADWSPALAERARCRILFDGLLSNRAALQVRFADRLSHDPSDADLVAEAYHRWGPEVVHHVQGSFALLIWDGARALLLCARDPLGMHPLFYAEVGSTLLFSPSIDALLRYPGVSTEINRAGLVDYLARRWLKPEETYFTHISRVPPGHCLRLDRHGRHVSRYWDPLPPERPPAWIPDDEVQVRFDALLTQVVERCLALGPAGVNLSGGVDSSTIAMAAAAICQQHGKAMPWALSLVFPRQDCDEETVQREVATRLGLPHVQHRLDEARGLEGMLAAALAMSRTLPAPMSMLWRVPLTNLALVGKQRGCSVLLTGEGADEWLGVSAFLTADLLRSLSLTGFYRLWRASSRAYPMHYDSRNAMRRLLWRLLWSYGMRPLLMEGERAPGGLASARWLVQQRQQRRATATGSRVTPEAWMAPDPTLHAQVARRVEESLVGDAGATRPESFYLRDTRAMLDLPQKWMTHEETFVLGRRMGLRVEHPFWDADLIDFLVRVRPHVLLRGGYSKALTRHALVRRFPDLGFAQQRKSYVDRTFVAVLSTQAAPARQALGSMRALAAMGVLDPAATAQFLENPLAGRGAQGWGLVWNILNLEAWTRAHDRSGA